VKDAIIGVACANAHRWHRHHDAEPHITTSPVLIGRFKTTGKFSVVWQTPSTVVGELADFLQAQRSDQRPGASRCLCGNFNVVKRTWWRARRQWLPVSSNGYTFFAGGVSPSAVFTTAVLLNFF